MQKNTGLWLLMMVLVFCGSSAIAQEDEERQKKVRIQIEKTEDGKTSRIDTTIITGPDVDLDQLLRELELEDQMSGIGDLNEDDDELEVIIRRKGQRGLNLNIDLDVISEKHGLLMHQVDSILELSMKTFIDGQPFLGVYFENLDTAATIQGVIVTKVIAGTAAQRAGLAKGDIITRVDERDIEIVDDLYYTIQTFEPGEVVKIHYLREGEQHTTEATIGKKNPVINIPELNLPEPQSYYLYKESEELSDRPFLGVYTKAQPSGENGVIVSKVIEGTTADKMGLAKGDLILKVNGKEVNSLEELKSELAEMEVGEKVRLKYLRDGKTIKSKEEIQGRPASRFPKHRWKFNHGQGNNFVPRAPAGPRAPVVPFANELKIVITQQEISKEEAALLALDIHSNTQDENVLRLDDLIFSPNPSEGRFMLSFHLLEEGDTQIRIADGSGKTIYEQKLLQFSGLFTGQVDISDNPAGIYYLQVTQNNKMSVSKILVQ
ncbi:MAG: PDZ domain-containing protein [Bacteroidia bacterium]